MTVCKAPEVMNRAKCLESGKGPGGSGRRPRQWLCCLAAIAFLQVSSPFLTFVALAR